MVFIDHVFLSAHPIILLIFTIIIIMIIIVFRHFLKGDSLFLLLIDIIQFALPLYCYRIFHVVFRLLLLLLLLLVTRWTMIISKFYRALDCCALLRINIHYWLLFCSFNIGIVIALVRFRIQQSPLLLLHLGIILTLILNEIAISLNGWGWTTYNFIPTILLNVLIVVTARFLAVDRRRVHYFLNFFNIFFFTSPLLFFVNGLIIV